MTNEPQAKSGPENETKFVLRRDAFQSLETRLKHLVPVTFWRIDQAYRDEHVRVRCFVPLPTSPLGAATLPTLRRIYSRKEKIGGIAYEVETDLDERVFSALWSVSPVSLVKHRYSFTLGANTWDVDFFKHKQTGATYYANAECEMPEGVERPTVIPELIAAHTLYEVRRGEKGFGNRKLANPAYAEALLQRLEQAHQPCFAGVAEIISWPVMDGRRGLEDPSTAAAAWATPLLA